MNKSLAKYLSETIRFLKTDIWRIRSSKLSGQKSFWIRQLRIILLAIRGFAEDKCQLRASALTYYSVMSVVPVLAMAFGIAKGLGFETLLEEKIVGSLQGQKEAAQQVIGFARSFLENTRGSLIAGIGVAALFWTVIKVLGNIESSFNWQFPVVLPRGYSLHLKQMRSVSTIVPQDPQRLQGPVTDKNRHTPQN